MRRSDVGNVVSTEIIQGECNVREFAHAAWAEVREEAGVHTNKPEAPYTQIRLRNAAHSTVCCRHKMTQNLDLNYPHTESERHELPRNDNSAIRNRIVNNEKVTCCSQSASHARGESRH